MRDQSPLFVLSFSMPQLPFFISEDAVAGLVNEFVAETIADIRVHNNLPRKNPAQFKCLFDPIRSLIMNFNDFYPLANCILYTGKHIDDFGDQDSCSLYESNKFFLVKNGTDEKGIEKLVYGVCVPSSCSKEDTVYIFESITSML